MTRLAVLTSDGTTLDGTTPDGTTLDSRVLADIYRMHGCSVHKYVRTLTHGDAQLAEDILQETFLRAWRTPAA